jgi:hypothetical protein
MPSGGFEPTIPASERPQTHTLDRAATGVAMIRRLHIFPSLHATAQSTGVVFVSNGNYEF